MQSYWEDKMSDNYDQYFATLGAKEFVHECNQLVTKFVQFTMSSGKAERWRRNYHFYYNRSNMLMTGWKSSDTRGIYHEGENGELTKINVNQYRNILLHIKNMITGTRPAYNARATNASQQAMSKTKLANNILEFVLRDKHLEERLTDAVEHSLIFDAGYVKAEWSAQDGEVQQLDLNSRPVMQGDIRFSNPSVWDVYFDINKPSYDDNYWMIVRSFRNKWELIEQYPEHAEALKQACDFQRASYNVLFEEMKNDDIPVYEFYHRKIPGLLPDGRYTLFCGEDTALVDMALPYTEIPIAQVTAGKDLGSQFGYSPANDIAPLQEAYNSNYSAIVTNHAQFGVQNLLVPRDSGIAVESLVGGMNMIEYDPASGGKPESINFVSTPPEVFNMLEQIAHDMETISGINSVIRGNPEASLQSGAALALIQNQSVSFMNHLQASYNRLMEKVGTLTVRIYQTYATSDRVISISGKNNKSAARSFNGTDLDEIKQVTVEVGNPLSKTVAGRIELAEKLIATGLIKDPERYISVLETGNLETLTEHATSQVDLIRRENEDLLEGVGARAMVTDDHRLHILEHTTILADPEMRANEELAGFVLSHIQEHVSMLSDPMNATLFQLLGQQSTATAPTVDPNMMQDPNAMPVAPGQSEAQMPSPAQPPAEAMPR